MTFRENGKIALRAVLSIEKNINILENNIFNISNEDTYNEYIYQTIGDILKGEKLKTILANIKSKKIGWKHHCFDDVSFKIQEQDEFILNPFTIEEGVLECRSCGSKRVFSYQKQCRGGDESSTTFAECINCKAKWTYSG